MQDKLQPSVIEIAGPVEFQSAGAAPAPVSRGRFRSGWAGRPSVAVRLFVTVWLLYVVHFASNIVRETYLAVALGERLSVRVDEYLGLHPDLFRYKDNGVYINNNPGASMLGAIPYFVARPIISVVFWWKPTLLRVKPPARYDDPRPNRTRFMNEARNRGVDIKLGLAAASMHVGLMAPLGATAAVAVFFFLRARLANESRALWLALLYAFGTPIFFRSAFLNQNAILTHCVLFAYLALAWPMHPLLGAALSRRRLAAAGFALGFGLLCDYSAVPLILVFGVWIAIASWRSGGRELLRTTPYVLLGAAVPVGLLLLYQWLVFGSPWLPAQAYMPATQLSVRGWNGFFWPDPELMARNLFDLRYGLFAFCPMLMAAVAAPWLDRRPGGPGSAELALIFGASAALYLFNSSVQFAYLQFNTGIRYMAPAAALLFFALVPVLLRLPRLLMYALVISTVAVSWSVSMVREDVPLSLARVFLGGFELPWLTTLRKMASGYAPFLTGGVSPVAIFALLAVILWLLWRNPARWNRVDTGPAY